MMSEAEIGLLLTQRIHAAIRDAIQEVNRAGQNFLPVFEDATDEWVDRETGQTLQVDCGLRVSLRSGVQEVAITDPVVARFIELAESGVDQRAAMLNQIEGDINNGGFSQLFLNKKPEFIREAVAQLESIGAQSAARIVSQAIALVESGAAIEHAYEKHQKALQRLDRRFSECRDNIAALYLESLAKQDS